jgi:hypothetical protein
MARETRDVLPPKGETPLDTEKKLPLPLDKPLNIWYNTHMKATQKHHEIESLLTSITGKSRPQMVLEALCTTCDGVAKSFKDEVSEKEYQISGMCQSCQDEIFG